MLPKRARLSSSDVELVLSKGISIASSTPKGQKSLISGRFLATSGRFRAAAVAPKAVAKSAVVRNRLRRAIYRALADLPTPKKAGIAVFFVRSIPSEPLTPAFAREIGTILEKIAVL